MGETRRFAIRYGVFRPLLTALGLGPRFSRAELGGGRLVVRMGWGFQARAPLSAVRDCAPSSGLVGGIGIHGWRGAWLVNGAASGLVTIRFEPTQRARVLGVPVALRALRISLEDPEGFLAALESARASAGGG